MPLRKWSGQSVCRGSDPAPSNPTPLENTMRPTTTCKTCDRHVGEPEPVDHGTWTGWIWPCEFDGRHPRCTRCRQSIGNGELIWGPYDRCTECHEKSLDWTHDELLELTSYEAQEVAA